MEPGNSVLAHRADPRWLSRWWVILLIALIPTPITIAIAAYLWARRLDWRRRTFVAGAYIGVSISVLVAANLALAGYEVDGRSMHPTLSDGERILVPTIFRGAPERGDVIVFRPPTSSEVYFVGRVIGRPGDIVDIHDGEVFVNGTLQESPVPTVPRAFFEYPISVPDGEYFIMKDNRRASNDSRNWGYVHAEDIEGPVVARYFPISRFRIF